MSGTRTDNFIRRSLLVLVTMAFLVLLSSCGRDKQMEAYEEACVHLQEGAYTEAQEAFHELAEANAYAALSYRGEGIAYMYQGLYPEADIAFMRAALEGENEGDAFARDVQKYLAYCRMKQGKTSDALEIYDVLIEEKEEPDLLYLRGRIYMSQDETDKATEDFKEACRLANDYNLYISIYELYKDHKMNADGADFLRDALKEAENEENDHYGRGVVEYYLENYDQAKEELIEALKEDPDDAQAVLLLGKTYLALSDAANARAMYRAHLSNPSCAAASYNGLAMCDLAEGQYDAALRNIEEGLALHDDGVEESLLYNEIIVYEHKEDWTSACVKAASFVARYPTNEAGQREYAFLSTR